MVCIQSIMNILTSEKKTIVFSCSKLYTAILTIEIKGILDAKLCYFLFLSEQVTDGSRPSEDWTIILEICDIINENDDGY